MYTKETVANDLIKFRDLYAGPEYCYYYRVAQTSVLCMITLIMGPSMPLLYFIGAWALVVSYFVDRLAITYFYRLPPKFNSKLVMNLAYTISFIPIFTLIFVFWTFTNQ